MSRATGLSHAGGHNLMNSGAPDLPVEPRRRETSEEHQARMDKKRAELRRFEQLDRAAAAPSTKSVTLDRARAIEAYRAGEGVEPIAKRFHIGPATLQAWLKEAGVPLRDAAAAREARRATPPTKPGPRQAPLDVDALTPAPAPAEPRAPRAVASRPPASRPVPRPPSATALRAPTQEDRDRLAAVTAYVEGDSVDEIAKRLGRGLSKIYAWLDAAGVPRRGRNAAAELDPAALAAAYRAGASIVALAKQHGTSPRRITAALIAQDVQIRRGRPSLPASTPAPAPALPPAAPSAPAPLSTPPPADPDQPSAPPVEVPTAVTELDRLREALVGRTPASTPQVHTGITAVREAVEALLAAADELSQRWTELQLARDLDAAGAIGRIRVSAEQVLALTNRPNPERTAS